MTKQPHPNAILSTVAHAMLAGIALWLVILGISNLRHPNDWAMGDWLINYSGGFVRRGLIGGALLSLHSVGLEPLWGVLLLQWALYAAILQTVWRLLQPLSWKWWLAALVFSPATLPFVLLDPSFAYRKEILFLALLSATIAVFLRQDALSLPGHRWQLSLLLTGGCAVCVLAHEGLLVYFPYLFAALLLGLRSSRRAALLFAAPLLLSSVLFLLASQHPGTPQIADAVCRSLGGQQTNPPPGLCGGAIDYLRHDAGYARHEVYRIYLAHQPWKLLPWLVVLPFFPAALGGWSYRRRDPWTAHVLALCTAAALGLSVSLFVYGTDWTRWIYIHAFSLMLLLLFAERQQLHGVIAMHSRPAFPAHFGWLGTATLLLYCFGWELSVYAQRPLYGSFFRYLRHMPM